MEEYLKTAEKLNKELFPVLIKKLDDMKETSGKTIKSLENIANILNIDLDKLENNN